MVVLGNGCDGGDVGDNETDSMATPTPLVEPHAWTVAREADDLFADQRPAEVECDPDRGMTVEETAWQTRFEINTGWCNYATVEQPLLESLEAGDTVEVRVWHFELTGQPAEAYLGVGLDGEVIWEETVPIPSEGELIKSTFEVDRPLPAGTPIQYHVHNHGKNTWELVSINRL